MWEEDRVGAKGDGRMIVARMWRVWLRFSSLGMGDDDDDDDAEADENDG